MTHREYLDKRRKLQALAERGATDGEKAAARAAIKRLDRRKPKAGFWDGGENLDGFWERLELRRQGMTPPPMPDEFAASLQRMADQLREADEMLRREREQATQTFSLRRRKK